MVDTVLDALRQRHRLLAPRDDKDHLARVHDRRDSDGESHARNGGEVIVEEARVGEDGVVRQSLDARPRDEGGTGLRRGCWVSGVLIQAKGEKMRLGGLNTSLNAK